MRIGNQSETLCLLLVIEEFVRLDFVSARHGAPRGCALQQIANVCGIQLKAIDSMLDFRSCPAGARCRLGRVFRMHCGVLGGRRIGALGHWVMRSVLAGTMLRCSSPRPRESVIGSLVKRFLDDAAAALILSSAANHPFFVFACSGSSIETGDFALLISFFRGACQRTSSRVWPASVNAPTGLRASLILICHSHPQFQLMTRFKRVSGWHAAYEETRVVREPVSCDAEMGVPLTKGFERPSDVRCVGE